MSPLLSELVRERTSMAHSSSEHSPLMKELTGEHATAAAHAVLLSQLHFVYQALEAGVSTFGDDAIAPMLDPRLTRCERIERDLKALLGSDHADRTRRLPQTTAYVASITEAITQRSAPRFLAHHYTRYLGDLSGGLIIAHNLRAVTGLGRDGGDGLRFHEFPGIPKPRAFKRAYAQAMNELPWDAAAREDFLATTCEAYRLNQALLDGVQAQREAWALA